MKKWLLHIMLISVLGILAVSCSQIIDDPTSGECELDAEKVQITFTLSMKAAAPDSRTWGTDYNPNNIGNEFENRIDLDNLQVLVFNGTAFVGEVNILAYWKVAENIYEFRGELPEATINTTTDYKVMVFANCQDVNGDTDLAALSFVFHGDDPDTEYIPMWGVKTTKFTLERFQNLGTINVLRAMAKVEVRLADALEGYTLEKVQLNAGKYNVGGFCLPTGYADAANTENMGLEAVFNPKNSDTTVPSGTVALEFEKIANTHYIYIPEYLTTLEADKPSMTVTLKDANNNTKDYALEFKYYSGDNEGTAYNIVRNHYYQYTITSVGKTIGFTADIYSWADATKVVNIIVEDFHWLYVKDKVLYMNNVDEITTTFDSSTDDLQWEIVDGSLLVYNTETEWDEANNGTQSVEIEKKLNGEITITSAIPNNFVGKEFKVRVWSDTSGKSESIQVYQFPPLYLTLQENTEDVNAGNNQTNSNLYEINTLLADFSWLPTTDDEFQLEDIQGENNLDDRLEQAWEVVSYLKNNARFGYPLTLSIHYDNVTSVIYNESKNVTNVDANITVETLENSKMISPHFILASQGGANSITDYETAKKNCAGYSETVKNTDGTTTTYGKGTWRMPTRAELMLIDLLQNLDNSLVKKILEGKRYQSAKYPTDYWYDMMDSRVNSSAVRCVRDIK